MAAARGLSRQQRSAVGAALQNGGAAAPVLTVTEGVSVQYLSLTVLSVRELSSLSLY